MKFITAELLQDVSATYDQTKTTIAGRVAQKIINAHSVLGAPLTKFIDVASEAALVPVGPAYVSPSGKMFIPSTVAAGLCTIALYDFNLTSGAHVYIGKIVVSLPNVAATTHTIRAIKVDDTGATWKIFILTTGSVLINGGLFMMNGIVQGDFVPVGFPTIPFATGSDQKAVYFLQDPAALGVGHTITVGAGLVLDTAAKKAFAFNGTSATYQARVFDYSGIPDVPGQTCTISGPATPGVVTAASHGFQNNDQVVFSTTGALPAPLVAGTVYFVRNAAAGTFEFSTTSGGASINTTNAGSGTHTVRCAFGITGSLAYYATGNLPALAGTILLTNSFDRKFPISGPNAGTDVASFATSSNIYEGQLSDLTVGATTWPSLRTCNVLGNGVDITAPIATYYQFSDSADRCIYVTNTVKFVVKQFVNNAIERVFGALNNTYYEQQSLATVNWGSATIAGVEAQSGWIFSTCATVGQRGVFAMDLRSDDLFDFSYIITKVLTVNNATLKFISTLEELFDSTSPVSFYYRTSGFGSASGGWISVATAEDLSSIASATQIQFKIAANIVSPDVSTPAQIAELIIGIDPLALSSDNWEGSLENSSGGSPTDAVFRLKKPYAGAVPALRFLATDLSDVLLVSHTTTAEAANFSYSTDDGATWLPLGTIPNSIGTLVRYRFSSPPGVKIRPGLKEA